MQRTGAGGTTTSAQAFYEKHGMEKCSVHAQEHCIARKAPTLALRELKVEMPDGLITSKKHAFTDDEIASLLAEVLAEDSSDGEEEQTDEGAPVVYDVHSIPAGYHQISSARTRNHSVHAQALARPCTAWWN